MPLLVIKGDFDQKLSRKNRTDRIARNVIKDIADC